MLKAYRKCFATSVDLPTGFRPRTYRRCGSNRSSLQCPGVVVDREARVMATATSLTIRFPNPVQVQFPGLLHCSISGSPGPAGDLCACACSRAAAFAKRCSARLLSRLAFAPTKPPLCFQPEFFFFPDRWDEATLLDMLC